MQLHWKKLEQEVSEWQHVSVQPHRFGGVEFQFGDAEVGHVHTNGIVDIPFPRSIHDSLLADDLAEEHHWVPNSGWVTFQMRSEEDLSHALWLMRLIRRRTEISCSEGIGFPGLEGAGSDLLKQMLLNLVVKRDDAMSVECLSLIHI